MPRCAAAIAATVMLAVGCSSSGEDAGAPPTEDSGAQIVERSEAAGSPGQEISLEQVGFPVNKYDLGLGECFNRYEELDETGVRVDETTAIDCTTEHEGEVFYEVNFSADSAAPFPGDGDLEAWADARCYEQFESFVGIPYELSALEIGHFRPTRETWEGAGLHREVTCFVYSFSGDALKGTMRGSEI